MGTASSELSDRLAAVRQRTFCLVAPLSDEQLERQADRIMSPPVWDLGHIAAYEELWLVCRLTREAALHPERAELYDAAETPRAARGDADLLDADACRRYLAQVRERSLAALEAADLGPDADPLTAGGFVFEMVAEHEAQHTETVLQALKLLPPGQYVPPRDAAPTPALGPAPDDAVEVPGGAFEMGAGPGGFAYDCERPRHPRVLEPYRIATAPATNAAHLAFLEDGGYRRQELWSEEGWAWRLNEGVEAPLYWSRDGEGGWLERDYEQIGPLDPERPVAHVSAHEADAHARWVGARLPTEAEWERAAGGACAEGANLGHRSFATTPALAGCAPSDTGCHQMLGDVWEWTSSGFDAYPAFAAFPYAEYAEVFFGGPYRALRGGSWATQPHAVRTTFRNWDHPERRQIFAGFRLAWDA